MSEATLLALSTLFIVTGAYEENTPFTTSLALMLLDSAINSHHLYGKFQLGLVTFNHLLIALFPIFSRVLSIFKTKKKEMEHPSPSLKILKDRPKNIL